MKSWIIRNKVLIAGIMIGAISGFLYWKFVGCVTGTCAITSNPIRSTIYFAVMGGLLSGMFRKNNKKEIAVNKTNKEDES